ncbi:MAG: tRNA lysidine(34) synthetase TilS [Deltaproteobacteria bacterium]
MSDTKFIDKILATIRKYKMIDAGDRIVVGVSGGPDSLCLLYSLNELKEKLGIELFVVHINHCIRGESANQDELFVNNYAHELGLEVHSERIPVKQIAKKDKLSIEEAGRAARYDCFQKYLKLLGANKIAVGHNMNDNVETFLINLIRGTGLEGLKGIEPIRDNIIRPLIETGRDEIENYCKEKGLKPRTDETNVDPAFTRNRIRNGLIPYIKENFNPNIINSINRTVEIIYNENLFTAIVSEGYYNGCLISDDEDSIKINIDKFNELHAAVRKRIVRRVLGKLKGSTKGIEKIHVEQVLELARKAKTGKVCRFGGDVEAKIEYESLIFLKKKPESSKDFCYNIDIPGEIEIPELNAYLSIKVVNIRDIKEINNKSSICLLDRKKLDGLLQIRNRRMGDRINPYGMKGTKKLKDFFIDEKIIIEQRNKIPVIADEQEIIWIIGERYSEKYKITKETEEVVILEYLLHK